MPESFPLVCVCVCVYTMWEYEGCMIHLRLSDDSCNESAITQRLASLTSAAAAAADTFPGFCGISAMNF